MEERKSINYNFLRWFLALDVDENEKLAEVGPRVAELLQNFMSSSYYAVLRKLENAGAFIRHSLTSPKGKSFIGLFLGLLF